MKKIKILIVNGGIMDRGGISAFILNYLKHFDFNVFCVDILVHGNEPAERDNEVKECGCKLYRLPKKSSHYFEWKRGLKNLLEINRYDIIHANADAGNGLILEIAKVCGIKVRISHSHNTNYLTENKLRIALNEIQKRKIKKAATELFACSSQAGQWLYNSERYTIIHNAIDYSEYSFKSEIRNRIREKNKLNNKFVVGHVGRFHYQKNHKFILEIAKQTCMDNDIVYLLIGEGELLDEIRADSDKMKLHNVIIYGQVSNVNEMLNAMDLFMMPSVFEGLPFSVIEAQVNGLCCIISSIIDSECIITDCTQKLAIDNPSVWADKIVELKNSGCCVNRSISDIQDNYNIETQSIRLQDIYIKAFQREK